MDKMQQPSDFSQLAQPFIHYSRNYSEKIKSSLISKDDLRELYKILSKKSNEAADLQLKLSPNLPDNIKEAFKSFKDKLWVEIWGENNEYISGDHESVFNDTRLPKKIIRIRFNNYNGYQIAMQNSMNNWFEVQFDFTKNRILDFSRLADNSNQNQSYFKVQGTDETWVGGVYQAIITFLKDKKLLRNWLYSTYTYDIVLYLLFFPLIFRLAYLVGNALHLFTLPAPLLVAVYIYLFIICIYLFRILFNYAKWIFPLIEIKNGRSAIHRGILTVLILSIISSAAYDLFKELPHLFFNNFLNVTITK